MLRGLYLVELTVADLDRSIGWYQSLGLSVALRDEATRYAVLEVRGGRLGLKEGQVEPGGMLIAFEVEDLGGELQRLAALDIVQEGMGKQSAEGYRRALLRDPDGHRLSLFEWETN